MIYFYTTHISTCMEGCWNLIYVFSHLSEAFTGGVNPGAALPPSPLPPPTMPTWHRRHLEKLRTELNLLSYLYPYKCHNLYSAIFFDRCAHASLFGIFHPHNTPALWAGGGRRVKRQYTISSPKSTIELEVRAMASQPPQH